MSGHLYVRTKVLVTVVVMVSMPVTVTMRVGLAHMGMLVRVLCLST